MEDYKKNTKTVVDYLIQKQACCCIVSAAWSCFNQFEKFLLQNGLEYSPEMANKWIANISGRYVKGTLSRYRNALDQLEDVYKNGKVRPKTRFKSDGTYKQRLNETLSQEMDLFLAALSPGKALATIRNYRRECCRILVYMQDNYSLQSLSGINYDLLIRFYGEDGHKSRAAKAHANETVAALLNYLYDKNVLPYGYTIIIHYLALDKGSFWNEVNGDALSEIKYCQAKCHNQIPLESYRTAQQEILSVHVQNKYSKSMRATYNKGMDLLYLFLDMNCLQYTPEATWLWYRELKPFFGTEYRIIRRSLSLIEQKLRDGSVNLSTVFLEKPNAFELLAAWCKPEATAFLEVKLAEGWEKSTLTMYRSCICRFCTFLNHNGITSYSQVTAAIIKEFNLQDMHRTTAGKNAYNVKIRKFLVYLSETRCLQNPMLFAALPSVSAPKETIVITLTEDEIHTVGDVVRDGNETVTLRKKAMLLLGLKMGIRSSDIVQLLLEDIDWEKVTLRFIQEKTDVEMLLPIPTDVANALYRYLMFERPDTEYRNIFIKERAPYNNLGRSACGRALDSALPGRDVPGSGFHVTRKTYATSLLRNGVGVDLVSEALGQKGTTTIHRYLSLDEERMRMCPLSLEAEGIALKGGDCHA